MSLSSSLAWDDFPRYFSVEEKLHSCFFSSGAVSDVTESSSAKSLYNEGTVDVMHKLCLHLNMSSEVC